MARNLAPQANPLTDERPRTRAELRAEAERIFPDNYVPTRKAGLGSVGKYEPAELRAAHRQIFGLGIRS